MKIVIVIIEKTIKEDKNYMNDQRRLLRSSNNLNKY